MCSWGKGKAATDRWVTHVWALVCPGCVNQWYGPGSSLCWRWTFYYRALKIAYKKQSIGSFGPRAFVSIQLCISFANFCGKGFADWRFQLFAGTAHAPFASTSCSAAHFPISAFRSGVGSSCFHLLELTCFTSHAMAVEGTSFKTRPSSHSTVAKVWQYSLA